LVNLNQYKNIYLANLNKFTSVYLLFMQLSLTSNPSPPPSLWLEVVTHFQFSSPFSMTTNMVKMRYPIKSTLLQFTHTVTTIQEQDYLQLEDLYSAMLKEIIWLYSNKVAQLDLLNFVSTFTRYIFLYKTSIKITLDNYFIGFYQRCKMLTVPETF